jgi:hypothetical protein
MSRRRLFRRRTNWTFVSQNLYLVVTATALLATAYAWSDGSTGNAPSNERLTSAELAPPPAHADASIAAQWAPREAPLVTMQPKPKAVGHAQARQPTAAAALPLSRRIAQRTNGIRNRHRSIRTALARKALSHRAQTAHRSRARHAIQVARADPADKPYEAPQGPAAAQPQHVEAIVTAPQDQQPHAQATNEEEPEHAITFPHRQGRSMPASPTPVDDTPQ